MEEIFSKFNILNATFIVLGSVFLAYRFFSKANWIEERSNLEITSTKYYSGASLLFASGLVMGVFYFYFFEKWGYLVYTLFVVCISFFLRKK